MRNILLARQGLLVLLAVATGMPGFAAGGMPSTLHPRAYCDLAAPVGYPSRGFNPQSGGCASNQVPVTPKPGPSGLENNLAYYSSGKTDDSSKLSRIAIILNVNNPREKVLAQGELARVADAIATALLGSAPPDLAKTIKAAGSKSWQAERWSIEVKTEVWRTGLGQDTSVFFKPKD